MEWIHLRSDPGKVSNQCGIIRMCKINAYVSDHYSVYIYTTVAYIIMQCHAMRECTRCAEEWLCQSVFDEETTRIDRIAQMV